MPAAVPAPWEHRRAATADGPGRQIVGLRAAAVRHGDVALAVAVFLALAIEVLVSSRREGPWAANLLGCAAIAAPLVLRRRRPLLSAAGVFAAASVQSLLLTPIELLVTPIALLIIPAYSVAAHLPLRPALAGLALCVLATIPLGPTPPSVLIAALAFAAGRAARDRTRRAAELREINAELERTRDAHAARARAEERLRISRELHDAVAHRMTVIVLQAGAAQRVWGHDPAAARVAVEALTDVARETLVGSARDAARRRSGPGRPARRARRARAAARARRLAHPRCRRRSRRPRSPGVRRGPGGAHERRPSRRADERATSSSVATATSCSSPSPTPGRGPGPHRRSRPCTGPAPACAGWPSAWQLAGGTLRYGGEGPGFRVEARLPLEPALAA